MYSDLLTAHSYVFSNISHSNVCNSHPAVGPQSYSESIIRTNDSSAWCGGDFIYSQASVGDTMGGSSGSPVVDENNLIIGQLYGVCGSDLNTPCNNVDNAVMDGRFSVTFPSIQDILDPSNCQGGCCDGTSCSIQGKADCELGGGTHLDCGASCITEAGSPTTYSASPGKQIRDLQTTTDTISVQDQFDIGDVNVSVDIAHTWVGDLVISLSHLGIAVILFSRGCGSQDNIDAIFDDGGSDLCSDLTSSSSLTPAQALSAFDGVDSAGDWTISVTDYANQDTGNLNIWELHIDGQVRTFAFDYCRALFECHIYRLLTPLLPYSTIRDKTPATAAEEEEVLLRPRQLLLRPRLPVSCSESSDINSVCYNADEAFFLLI